MKKNMLCGLILFLLSLGVSVFAAAPSAWIPVGNEKEIEDARNVGRDLLGSVTYLTEGNSIDTHFHYHGQTWGDVNGRTYLFFSSSRERPEAAGQTVEGERQIMAADATSGDLYYLTTIPSDGVSFLSHMNFRIYNATYDNQSKSIFFWSKNRTVAYAYNCLTGAQKELFVLPDQGTSRELYSWTDDQMIRLIYTYSVPDDSGVSPAYPRSEYLAIADLDYNFNVLTNWVVKSTPIGGALNHPEINPKNKNQFFYQRKSGAQIKNMHEHVDFLLHDLVTGTDTPIKPDNGKTDHQIWGKSGETIYWDNNRGKMCAYNWRTKAFEQFGESYQGHNKLSRNEKLWVYDVNDHVIPGQSVLFTGQDPYGVKYENWIGSIWIYNRETQQRKLMTIFLWGGPHPRHPHAVFSQDDSMISFVTAANMTNANTRIAIMKVKD